MKIKIYYSTLYKNTSNRPKFILHPKEYNFNIINLFELIWQYFPVIELGALFALKQPRSFIKPTPEKFE